MAKAKNKGRHQGGVAAAEIAVDLHRGFVFPNRMREQRRAYGFAKLLRLAATIPEIPYIRLSKIERGEVFARPDELKRIAAAIGVAPADLLIDIDAAGFDIAAWAEPFREGMAVDEREERFAVLLGAALRARRTADPALTIAAIDRDYGLPPVNLSRVENAHKPFARWNPATQSALFALFGVADEAELRGSIEMLHASGALDAWVAAIASPSVRHNRSRQRIAELAAALDGATPILMPTPTPAPVAALPMAASTARTLRVLGGPLANGLIADVDTGAGVEAPAAAGPRAFALRLGRATLGAGLPAQSIVVADPDRFPAPGGLAALREADGWRLLSVGSGRDGRMIGYSVNPEAEVALDDCDPGRLATIVAALFV